MVTADLPKPELKDDFFLNVNYEWLRDTAMKPDMPKIGGLNDVQSLVEEQAATLLTDESITGREAEMVREIIAAYREMLLEETWLTEETREMAVRKLDAMALNAVRPDSWQDWSGFTFRTRSEGGSFFEAYSELRRCKMELKRKNSYGKPNPGVWSKSSAYATNAQYDKPTNSINIYAGILNGDYYQDDMPREQMLAGIGSVIAHEISHAFDPEGSQFDETGTFRDWWSEADRAAFVRRVDAHPMDQLRVNLSIAQFPEFQETYDIQPGDGMYVAPEDRIAIWGID